jgi:hypothetical protein
MKANFEGIYEHIGYLFYALASEQRSLSEYDLKKLTLEIAEAWQPLTNVDSTLHDSLIKHMNDAITLCHNEAMPSNNAFELFEDYYFVHHGNFSQAFEDKILLVATELSHEFFSTLKNRKGSGALRELKNLFHPRAPQKISVPAAIIEYKDGLLAGA